MRAVWRWIRTSGKRIAVTVFGFSILLAGLAGLVFPVIPGIPLLIAGFALLATEYAWARRALDETKKRAQSAGQRLRRRKR